MLSLLLLLLQLTLLVLVLSLVLLLDHLLAHALLLEIVDFRRAHTRHTRHPVQSHRGLPVWHAVHSRLAHLRLRWSASHGTLHHRVELHGLKLVLIEAVHERRAGTHARIHARCRVSRLQHTLRTVLRSLDSAELSLHLKCLVWVRAVRVLLRASQQTHRRGGIRVAPEQREMRLLRLSGLAGMSWGSDERRCVHVHV